MKKDLSLCLVLAALTLLSPLSPGRAAPQVTLQRLTAPVEQKDLPIDIELTGVFKAEDKSEISVEPEEFSGSLIVMKLAAEGSAVKEGDLLLKLDKRDIQKAISSAEGAIDEARLKYNKMKAEHEAFAVERKTNFDKMQKELDLAQRRQEAVRRDIAFKIEEQEKEIRQGENSLKDGAVNLEQLKELYGKKELHTATENILVEREERNFAEMKLAHEVKRRKIAHAREFEFPIEQSKADMEVAQKEAELKKLQIQIESMQAEKDAQVTKAERELKSAEEKKAALEQDLEKCTVKSPRAGILFYGETGEKNTGPIVFKNTQGELRVGGRITTHQILLTVASMENLSVNLKVLENDIQHIKPGLPVTIRPDAFPDLAIQGQVKEVGQVATRGNNFFDETRDFSVTATYEGRYPQLRAGMNCRVTVHADKVENALQVPVLAVFDEGGKLFCYAQEGGGGKPIKREVKTGPTNGKAVQILEGLKTGETVLLYDPFRE